MTRATWQRCRVHFMRDLLAHCGKSGRRVVSAFVATAFARETPETAKTQWRQGADQLRPKVPKPATPMNDVQTDVGPFRLPTECQKANAASSAGRVAFSPLAGTHRRTFLRLSVLSRL